MDINNTITEAELDEILGENISSGLHRTNLIADKNIDPKSPNFGKKGGSHFITCRGVEQWYIQYKGDTDSTRVHWYQLDSNVSEGSYGQARYIGINPSIYGKVGELTYTSKKWIFHFEDEKYPLNSPASVEIL